MKYPGSCQGVIALNMEDGTLHRFRAGSTILATGVQYCSLLLFIRLGSSYCDAFFSLVKIPVYIMFLSGLW